jgi:UDP-N-acetyl-D-galactosamine dehydrogenase
MVTILGLTFKENVSDLRNTRVVDIIHALKSYSFEVQVHDPLAHPEEAVEEYGIELTPLDRLQPAQAVVLAVSHDLYRVEGWGLISRLLQGGQGVVADVRNLLPREEVPEGIALWRL